MAFKRLLSCLNPQQESAPVVHLVRAWGWWAAVPVFVLLGWHQSVFVIFIWSTYANFATDLSVYKAAQAKQAHES